MTDNEMLLALSDLFDKKLKPVKDDVKTLKDDVKILKDDVKTLKDDVGTLKNDVGALKDDVGVLKDDVGTLKDDVKALKLQNENDILPRLQNIESCYTSTYTRYKNGAEQIEAMQADIDIMKKVISEHSEKLQRIG